MTRREQNKNDQINLGPLLERYEQAKNRRQNWVSHWQECYEYSLPQRSSSLHFGGAGTKRVNNLYDGTALDVVDQLSASMLANLTPPWT